MNFGLNKVFHGLEDFVADALGLGFIFGLVAAVVPSVLEPLHMSVPAMGGLVELVNFWPAALLGIGLYMVFYGVSSGWNSRGNFSLENLFGTALMVALTVVVINAALVPLVHVAIPVVVGVSLANFWVAGLSMIPLYMLGFAAAYVHNSK